MRTAKDPTPTRPTVSLRGLSMTLWFIALGFLAYAVWLFFGAAREWANAVVCLLVALVAGLSGVGLWRMRRWGVMLFGGLAVAGSVNYLAGAILRFPNPASVDPAILFGNIFSLLAGIIIPLILAYITISLWKVTH